MNINQLIDITIQSQASNTRLIIAAAFILFAVCGLIIKVISLDPGKWMNKVITVSAITGCLVLSAAALNISSDSSGNQVIDTYAVAAFTKAQQQVYYQGKQYIDQDQLVERIPRLKEIENEVEIIVSQNRKSFTVIAEECKVRVSVSKARWSQRCLNHSILNTQIGLNKPA
jgi:hypothetical protein